MAGCPDPWDEPTGKWEQKPAATIEHGDYVCNSAGERLRVLASYAGTGGQSASATLWYLECYALGKPTRRLGCDPSYCFPVEVREL